MEQIDRRLRELRRELQPAPNLTERLSQAGLTVPVLGFMSGVLLQHHLEGPLLLWLTLLALQLPLALLLWRQRHHPVTVLIAAGMGFCVLGALRMLHDGTPSWNDIEHVIGADVQVAAVRGRVATQPQIYFDTGASTRPNPLSPTTTFTLRVDAILGRTQWQPARGSLSIRIGEPMADLAWGDAVELYGQLAPVRPASNPGQWDRARSLAHRNIKGTLAVKNAAGMLRPGQGSRGVRRWLQRVPARWARAALMADFHEKSPHTGLLRALILGDRTGITSRTYDAFARTGLLHLISLSGLHVGLLLALVWRLGRCFGLLKPGRAVLSLGMLLIFMLVVPARPPTVRAVVIGSVFCVGVLMHRYARPWHSLACAAMLLLWVRPTQLFEVGWQLSFACVVGILLWAEPIRCVLMSLIGESESDRPFQARDPRSWGHGLVRSAVALLSIGVSAYLGGAGVLITHFHTITPLACVWTVLVMPLIALLLNLGFLKLIFGMLPGVHALGALVMTGILHVTTMLVHVVADLPPGPLVVGAMPQAAILMYYLLLLGLTLWYRLRPRTSHWPWLAAAMLIITFAALGAVRQRKTEGLILTCLDVGHGQALVLQIQDQVIMLDAGSLYNPEVGRSIILPFLNHRGLPTVHALVLSHHDSDHINAVPQLMRYGRIRRLLAPTVLLARIQELGEASVLYGETGKPLPIEILPPNLPVGNSARLEVLWPSTEAERVSRSDNNSSAVLLLHYAGRRILFCSDIEAEVQGKLLARHPQLTVDVLVAPHHASLKTLHPEFIPQLKPRVVLGSCTRSQFQQGRVLRTCPGREVWLTARDGAIEITIDPQGNLQTTSWFPRIQ